MGKENKIEKWVREAIESLPLIFREKLQNIQIVVEDEPRVKLSKEYFQHPVILLGLYQGVPLIKRRIHHTFIFPDKITIFRHPIEKMCSSDKKRRELVIKIFLHELGHYFGLSEKELREIKS